MHVNAIDRFASIPLAPVSGKWFASRMARHTGHDVDLVACGDPLAAMFVRARGWRVDFGRKVVRQEEDAHVTGFARRAPDEETKDDISSGGV